MALITVGQCKVCNSAHRSLIEELSAKGMSPEKIYDYLQSLMDPADKKIVLSEKLTPSGIRRHIQKHFDKKDDMILTAANIKSKEQASRQKLKDGIKIHVDNINTLAHMVEIALIRLEELDNEKTTKKHQYTVSYMTTIKGLIDELQKISGNIKQEGTIDSNFFRTEINTFAELVLTTIRALDIKYNMNFELETDFAAEFKKQMQLYKDRQNLIFSGQLSPTDGEKERNINKFNDSNYLV